MGDMQMRYLVYCWFGGEKDGQKDGQHANSIIGKLDKLPGKTEIEEYFENLKESNEGRPAHYLHELSVNRQWEYLKGLDLLMEGTNFSHQNAGKFVENCMMNGVEGRGLIRKGIRKQFLRCLIFNSDNLVSSNG